MISTTLWTALITPMKEDGSVHYEDLERLVRRQEEAGNGILLIGSTGEGLALDKSEKLEIVTFVAGLGLRVPVMAGVGGFNLEAQKQWIRACNPLEIDAFLLVAPLYSKPGNRGQVEWFRELLECSEYPCMVYNIPGRTGVKIPPEVVRDISGHPNFWSVKEASGSIREYQQFRETVPEIPLYSGDDGLLPYFAAAGCNGLVSVASNVWPKATRRYVEQCLNGETKELFPLWKQATEILFSASNPIPAKCLLKEKGVISTSKLRLPLTDRELDSVDRLLRMDQEISNWLQKKT